MHRKSQIAAAVGVALLSVGGTAFGQAAPNVQVYGQVSRTLMFADDGIASKWFNVDNEASGTRLGVTGGAPVFSGLRAGFRIEVDLQSNESQRVTFTPQTTTPANTQAQNNFPGTDDDTGGFADRYFEVWLEGAWGRLNLGQGDGAANGASESDLSGTGMANGIGVADIGGAINYTTGTTTRSTVNINATINQQDFESRYDRLLYTTPTFGGLRGQVSWGQKGASGLTQTPANASTYGQPVTANTDVKEAALFYGNKLGGLGEIAAAAGYSVRQPNLSGGTKDVYKGGSVSWLHTSGFNLTASYTNRDQPTSVPGTNPR